MSQHNLHGAASKAGGGSTFSLFDSIAESFAAALGSLSGSASNAGYSSGSMPGSGAGAAGQNVYLATVALVLAAAGYVFLPTVGERVDDLLHALSLKPGGGLGGVGGKRGRKQVPGLINYANWCFANATLQALASVHCLRLWLAAQIAERSDDSEVAAVATADSAQPGDGEKNMAASAVLSEGAGAGAGAGDLTRALSALLRRLQIEHSTGGGSKVLSSMGVVGALERLQQRAVGRAQQDAQEFLHLLLEGVAAEVNGCRLEDSLAQMRSRVERSGRRYRQLPLEGTTVTTTVCNSCGNQIARSEAPFLELTLHPPRKASWWSSSAHSGGSSAGTGSARAGKIDLQSMLDAHFGEPEEIEDYACDHCVLSILRARNANAGAPLEGGVDVDLHERRLKADPGYDLPRTVRQLAGNPKSTIVRSTRLRKAPQALCLHVNRSVFDPTAGIFASGAAARNAVDVGYGKRLVATADVDVDGGVGGDGEGGGDGEKTGQVGQAGQVENGRKTEKVTYELRSIVVHQGHHDRGHYTCYKRVRSMPPPPPSPSAGLSSPAGSAPAGPAPATESDAGANADAEAAVETIDPVGAQATDGGAEASADARRDTEGTKQDSNDEKQTTIGAKTQKTRVEKKPTTRWYAVSDEVVRQVDLDQVLSHGSDLFLSFWKRRP